jgi:hypothetical protein
MREMQFNAEFGVRQTARQRGRRPPGLAELTAAPILLSTSSLHLTIVLTKASAHLPAAARRPGGDMTAALAGEARAMHLHRRVELAFPQA